MPHLRLNIKKNTVVRESVPARPPEEFRGGGNFSGLLDIWKGYCARLRFLGALWPLQLRAEECSSRQIGLPRRTFFGADYRHCPPKNLNLGACNSPILRDEHSQARNQYGRNTPKNLRRAQQPYLIGTREPQLTGLGRCVGVQVACVFRERF